jgi:hypothetical protein
MRHDRVGGFAGRQQYQRADQSNCERDQVTHSVEFSESFVLDGTA